MARVSFYTLGCKLNYAETGALQESFVARNFEAVAFGEPADVTVVNTCTVTDEADRKCRQVIRRALRANPHTFVIVTGCYAQLQPEEIAAIPGVDAVLGAREKFNLFGLIRSFEKGEASQVHVSCIDEADTFGPAYHAGERARAFLKVQDGCDYTCAFCTIPLARGRSRSQSIHETVRQAQDIAGRGFREIVLSGVNIGLFGEDSGESLLDLVAALDAVDGVERYRISSIEPNLLTDALIDFVAGSRAFQPHFHLPLQSGDDAVLGAMRRRYRSAVYTARVERILSVLPHAAIGADVIVGFPAEDDRSFETTHAYLADLPLAYLHAFTYSERPNTAAVGRLLPDGKTPVPPEVRSRRNRRLRVLSEQKRLAFYRTHLGQTRPVHWEHAHDSGLMHGYTDNYIRVEAPYEAAKGGRTELVFLAEISAAGDVVAGEAGYIGIHG
ncbi:MAG: tRNA (N(6)-L-threonylcarbamoyladenosine(37)-C(2))-methylthiotransferase MtaB [Rhodothermales bacterium]|mgnify:CR=1 FL=1|nr:tRNA (N(6)-L-threonylcarbamoyladenosine(37)-C(2))-methylthiotransferase MtaB [Rhodothermales bacterium]